RARFTRGSLELLSIPQQQAHSARTVSAKSSGCASSGSYGQSTRFVNTCGRPAFETSAELSVECRAGTVHRKQPESVVNVHRCYWTQPASGDPVFERESEFSVCFANRQLGDIGLPCSTAQAPAPPVARVART